MKQRYFRGFRDILPNQITHSYSENNDNLFGSACYITYSPSIARAYAYDKCKKFGIMVTYEMDHNENWIELTEGKDFLIKPDNSIKCLQPMLEKTKNHSDISGIPTQSLAKYLFDMGFEVICISLKAVIGDDDVIFLLKNESIIKPICFDLVLKPYNSLFEVLGDKFDVPYDYIENIPIDKAGEASFLIYKNILST